MAITLVGLGGCSEKRSQPLAIDNSLTQEEIAAGVLSPEVMWKMGRVGLASLSPDASRLLYTVTLVQYAGEPGRYGDLRS